ncbi:serine hydrolase [Streptomyces mirabilis]|uniref:serine hydrolase n=1 Tax=Streptomyces mirabilis TaxID=68239 RepID=UPI0035D966A4
MEWVYGLGWALGPSGQMCLSGRLPGYRAAMVLIPDEDYVTVVVTNQQHTLRATATFLSDMQHPLTNDDLTTAIDRFAA